MSRAVRSSTAGHDRERVAHHVSTATSTNEAPSNYVYLSVLDGFGTWRGPDLAQGLRWPRYAGYRLYLGTNRTQRFCNCGFTLARIATQL